MVSERWADVLGAVASLLWPLVLVAVLVLFRKQLRDFIARSDEIQTPLGTLRAPLDPAPAEQVKRQLPRDVDPPPQGQAVEAAPGHISSPHRDVTQLILDLATRHVRIALIKLLNSLENRIRDLAAAWGVMVWQQKSKGRTGEPQGSYPTRNVYSQGDVVGWQWSFEETIHFYWPAPDGTVRNIISALFAGELLRHATAPGAI